jgi:Transglycosylase SLT domain/Sel1 repeat
VWRERAALALAGALAAIAHADATAQTAATRELVARAVAYEHGEGVAKDPQLAVTLYCQAARSGDPDAQFGLGWMYANGRGLPRDDRLAAGLFALAAAQRHEHARRMLSVVGEDDRRLPECLQATMPAAPTLDADAFANLPAEKQKYAELVRRLAPGYGIRPRLALAVIAVESNFEPRARSPKDAQGLMQLIPGTASRFKVRNAFDPTENVHGGLAYLRWLLAYYRGQVTLVAAAYNAGENAVDRHRGVPPYAETREYVRRIQRYFPSEEHPYDPSVVEPSPLITGARSARM